LEIQRFQRHPTLPTLRNYFGLGIPPHEQGNHAGKPGKDGSPQIPEAPADKGMVKPVRGGTDTAGEVYVFRPERKQRYFRGIAWRELDAALRESGCADNGPLFEGRCDETKKL
jgi:hypothetical protein